jgi:hypothetical protein
LDIFFEDDALGCLKETSSIFLDKSSRERSIAKENNSSVFEISIAEFRKKKSGFFVRKMLDTCDPYYNIVRFLCLIFEI